MFRKIIIPSTIGVVAFCIIIIGMLRFLDVSQTEVEHAADIIVSLGGGTGSRVEKAWELYKKNYSRSDKLIITGIPVNPEKVINIHPRLKFLKEHKEIRYQPVSVLEAKNTWEEALFIKHYMLKHSYKSVIIVTHPLHSGRVKMSLDRVAHFMEAGLRYTVVSDSRVDFLKSFIHHNNFRNYALLEFIKCIYYEVKVLFYAKKESV